ncbi:alpha/beta hydrolase [Roseibium sp.]|uniref:alpha/beta hydrolase n=1 Tax=Roseibium sp. TaxID=1936156 RepID=UPI003A97E248
MKVPVLAHLSQPAALPLALGMVFAAASLTPSLVPREWALLGLLAGLVLAIGYMLGRLVQTLWRAVEFPEARGTWLFVFRVAIFVPALVLLVHNLLRVTDWQNSVRAHVGMEPAEDVTMAGIVLLMAGVFTVLYLLGFVIQWLFDRLRFRLYRYMAPRAAGTLGLVLLVGIAFIVSRDWVLPAVLQGLDNTYETAQNLFDTAPPPPGNGRVPGGPGSLVSWEKMGQPGRNFVTRAPSAAEISTFTGRPATDPIRVYVGRSQDDSAEARAELALQELKRLNAFDRKILVVASPTGTGWLDPGGHDTLEFMHDGDIATVAVQYSYMQSPMALIFETRTGLDQATATMRTIYRHWRSLPQDGRPRLYMHGLSLGAWSSMYAFDIFQMINEPISGALWTGSPFPSYLWGRVTAARNDGSPYVLPKVEEGEVIRFASQYVTPKEQGETWGRMRIAFLQYASDAIVFFDPNSFWRPPVWMREPLAPDVSPELRFMPVVTQLQLGLDMLLATHVPDGFGHNYAAGDYIEAWAAVSQPEAWNAKKAMALKTLCEGVPGAGCSLSAALKAAEGK